MMSSSPEPPPPRLHIQNLSLRRGRELILDDVSLRVEPGTIHALVGPNGGGKTTLLRCILGELEFQGSIELYLERSGSIGYVPQSLQLPNALPLTVQDFFLLFLQRRPVWAGRLGTSRHRIQEQLVRTGCEHLLDSPLASLSGGELRRVLLAQALIPEPELLLLDEPVSHVDAYGAELLEHQLLELRNRLGLTILLVEHDWSLLTRLADSFTALNRQCLRQGDASELSEQDLWKLLFQQKLSGTRQMEKEC